MIEPDSTTAAAVQRLSAAKNATKQAIVGAVAAPLVAGSLETVEDAGDAASAAAASAQRALDKKLVAAGLPSTAALTARAKNATVVPAKAKGKAAIQTLRNATDTVVGAAWDGAAQKSNTTKALFVAGKNASSSALATKRAIEDAALDSDKGEARFSVIVTLNPEFNSGGGNGVEGAQYSPTARPGLSPLLSQLGKAKQSAIDNVKAAVNASFPGASAAKASVASAVGFGGGGGRTSATTKTTTTSASSSSSSVSSPASVSAAASSPPTPGFVTPVTVPIAPAEGTSRNDSVSFSAATVLGLDGNTFFTPTVVDPYDISLAVRAMLISKLRMLAAEGSADASALLSLGDSSSNDGQRTAAPLLSARGVALDAGAGVYLVSVSFPALLPGAPLPLPATELRSQLINAVNDVSPDNPCASLAERTGFDVCNAIDDATHLTISGPRLRAVETTTPGGAGGADGPGMLFLPFGRRSKSSEIAPTAALPVSAAAAAEDPVVDAAAYAAAATAAPTVATSNDYVAAALGETTKVAAVAEEGAGVLQFLAKANTVFSVITGAYSVYTLINDYFHPDKTPTAQTLK